MNVADRMDADISPARSGEDQLKLIFDLCDQDKDGLITAQDFRSLGNEHFGNSQQIDSLIETMDPDDSGHISFSMFRQGVESFIAEHQRLQSSSSSSWSLSTNGELGSREESDTAFSSDDVYPANVHFLSYLSQGYTEPQQPSPAVELVVEPPEESSNGEQQTLSSPTSTSESPTLLAKNLMRRHNQLNLPESPSQGSTPAELAEEEVTKLSDQLLDLTSKLEDLQEDQKDNEEYRQKLKKENTSLMTRLEECEEQLRQYEHMNEKILSESQDKLNNTVTKMRRQSEQTVLELKSELLMSTEQLNKIKETEATLRSQLSFAQQEVERKDTLLSEAEDVKRSVAEELRRTREQLNREREKWHQEREVLKQEVDGRDHQLQQLQMECEDIKQEKKQSSITASDMDREINRLKKELEAAKQRNEDLESQFIQHGKELLAQSKPQSLAAEMETASKDEVVKALHETVETNARLHMYIEGLLANIIDKYPELLEKR